MPNVKLLGTSLDTLAHASTIPGSQGSTMPQYEITGNFKVHLAYPFTIPALQDPLISQCDITGDLTVHLAQASTLPLAKDTIYVNPALVLTDCARNMALLVPLKHLFLIFQNMIWDLFNEGGSMPKPSD